MYYIDSLTTNHGVSNSMGIDNYADYATTDLVWHNKFIETFPTSLLTLFASFSPFCKQFEEESQPIKDKRKHWLAGWLNGRQAGRLAGRQADEMWVNFKIHCRSDF